MLSALLGALAAVAVPDAYRAWIRGDDGIRSFSVSCRPQVVAPGDTFTIFYTVELDESHSPIERGLGAALVDRNGGEVYDKLNDVRERFERGRDSRSRPFRVPRDQQPGLYRVDGGLWKGRFGGEEENRRIASCPRALRVTR